MYSQFVMRGQKNIKLHRAKPVDLFN